MHGIGAHSAVAIKRQRRRREQAARRKGPRTVSDVSRQQQQMSNKVMGTITMFHVGAVFLIVGLFLMLAAIITNETNQAEIAELIGTGVVCLVIGLFLIMLNRFYGQKEEEELQNYVEQRLGRSRSGQRLYHETDSYPERLDEAAPSQAPSVDSELALSADNSKNKNKKKNKGITGPRDDHGGHVTTTVSIVNEHNHHGRRREDEEAVSSKNVALEHTNEENAGRSGNLYRVYNATTA